MESQIRKLDNSLDALGLQRFTDEKYYKYGGYPRLIEMFEAGATNADIARAFSPKDRTMTRSAPRPWRVRWELEKKHPELRMGGLAEEAQ